MFPKGQKIIAHKWAVCSGSITKPHQDLVSIVKTKSAQHWDGKEKIHYSILPTL